MNRDLKSAASMLSLKPSALRQKLRDLRVLNSEGALAARYIGKGHLFMDPRSRWNPNIKKYSHYAVVMVTEPGVAWLAHKLGISVTITKHKDAAA